MEFWNREKEIEYLKRYIKSEPNAILFVYGPKSSGKSTLLMEVIDRLMVYEEFSSSHTVYWFDLRGTLVSNYESVVDLFFVDEESAKKLEKSFKFGVNFFITAEVEVKELMKEKRLDPFRYMEGVLRKNKRNVIVFDEIQKLKEVYLNSPSNQRPLIKELFNFFVRLTKVLHLSHVIVMTSDTFFIERVYTDSTLENTSRYYLVDFFDEDTTLNILLSHGISKEDAAHLSELTGGVPWILEQVLGSDDPRSTLEEIYKQTKARLKDFLINYEDEKRAIQVMRNILDGDFELSRDNVETVRDLLNAEILFYDPINARVRFQTRLYERVAREITGV